ncbi:DUF397 domain-containing protein [Streptomyces chattanoogensis]|uniref:DUF397 domain-containing protein n=1 Tax=Streptomyces chattanoogensis TaxID=66876 RepID=UPI0036CA60C1
MRAIDLSNVTWRKSSYSNTSGGECLEIADNHPALVPVRDSKNPTGPTLVFNAPAWGSFVTVVKDGSLSGA